MGFTLQGKVDPKKYLSLFHALRNKNSTSNRPIIHALNITSPRGVIAIINKGDKELFRKYTVEKDMYQYYIEDPPVFQKATMQYEGKTTTKRAMYTNYAECLKNQLLSTITFIETPPKVTPMKSQHIQTVVTPSPNKSKQSSIQKQLHDSQISDHQLILHLQKENQLLKDTISQMRSEVNQL